MDRSKPLTLAAQMQAPAWLKDDSVSIKLVTSREISDEQFVQLSKFKKVSGWLMFSANQLDPGELPKEGAPVDGRLSPSMRLRNHLFALHMQSGGSKETFPAYYESKIEMFISTVKDALDAL